MPEEIEEEPICPYCGEPDCYICEECGQWECHCEACPVCGSHDCGWCDRCDERECECECGDYSDCPSCGACEFEPDGSDCLVVGTITLKVESGRCHSCDYEATRIEVIDVRNPGQPA